MTMLTAAGGAAAAAVVLATATAVSLLSTPTPVNAALTPSSHPISPNTSTTSHLDNTTSSDTNTVYASLVDPPPASKVSKKVGLSTQDFTDPPLNVLHAPLEPCSFSPLTGFFRTGSCETGPFDAGRHTVCAEITEKFLQFSKQRGNDLSTPRPEYTFPGLKEGDRWCLCALRWREALEESMAPKVVLEATHLKTLEITGATVEELKSGKKVSRA
ncbi:hypothetical protein HDV05_006360 [Chytridiales sp. JEL 0842]|nr:hypothetical protein HDV05_006360 [Chytridiales sp. JEL 0842]